MNTAQKDLIASEICGMTTLCATVIAPLKYNNSSGTLLFFHSLLFINGHVTALYGNKICAL